MTTAVAAYSPTEAALIDLAAKYKGVVYDVTIASGMAEAKKARNEIREHRTTLEKARVQEKAESLAYGKFIDSEAKRISDRIAELEEPIAGMIKAEEDKAKIAEQEAMRIAAEKMAAEEAAKKEKEASDLAAARAEIVRAQAEIDRVKREQLEFELKARRVIEEEQRQARLKIEEEERKSRLVLEDVERETRKAKESQEAILKAEKDRLEAAAKEEQRLQNELLDGNGMLSTFCERFGHRKEFSGIAKQINEFLESHAV